MERWSHGSGIGSVHGRCRVHRAEILRLRGATAEAEQEALAACAELRPYLRREFGWPLTELGRIRLQLGDLAGAEEAFLAAREAGWDPEPGLARVRLAQGDVALAAASIRDALDHPVTVPSKERPPNTDLRRAPLLAARVEIDVAAGDLIGARDAADELARVAASFQSRALAANAAMADGRVRLAVDDPAGARHAFETAIRAVESGRRSRMRWRWHERTCPRPARPRRSGRGPRPAGTRRRRRRRGGSMTPARPNCLSAAGRLLVAFLRRTTRVALRDLKGLRYLARLLAILVGSSTCSTSSPMSGTPTRTSALTTDPELTPSRWGDAGAALDAHAKNAYRRRLAEIDEDLEEARRTKDHGRAAQAEADATSSSASCRELWGSEGVTGEPAPRQNAPASASRARFATH